VASKKQGLERWKKGEASPLPHEEKAPITSAVKSNEMYWKQAAKKPLTSRFETPRLKSQ